MPIGAERVDLLKPAGGNERSMLVVVDIVAVAKRRVRRMTAPPIEQEITCLARHTARPWKDSFAEALIFVEAPAGEDEQPARRYVIGERPHQRDPAVTARYMVQQAKRCDERKRALGKVARHHIARLKDRVWKDAHAKKGRPRRCEKCGRKIQAVIPDLSRDVARDEAPEPAIAASGVQNAERRRQFGQVGQQATPAGPGSPARLVEIRDGERVEGLIEVIQPLD